MADYLDRWSFVTLGFLCEAGLVLLAALGWWLFPISAEVDPLLSLARPTLSGLVGGAFAAMPILALFLLLNRFPVGPFRAIRQFLNEQVGPSLCRCRWYDLIVIATLAGVGEEIFFRGVLQPRMGLVWSNVVFGLMHAITPVYALVAGLLGAYLGGILTVTGSLWASIVAHALYDYLAFLVVIRECRPTVLNGDKEVGAGGAVG